MAVRRAKIQNHADKHAIAPTRLLESITVVTQEASTEISLHGGLQLIVGPNGGGKTTLLRAIRDAVNGGEAPVASHLTAHSPHTGPAWDSSQGVCIHIDPAIEVSSFLNRVAADPNWQDLLDGVGSNLFSTDELEWASYILGRNYESISVLEIEASDDRVFPYFSASYGGVDFELPSMGLGEVVVFYFIWRMRLTPSRSMLFIEEPETHLSWEAQRRLADFLLVKSQELKIQFFVATHSPTIIQSGYCAQPIFVRTLPDAMVENGGSIDEACRKLGAPAYTVRTAILEDGVAMNVAMELLLQLDPDLAATTGFGYDTRGASGVISSSSIVVERGNPMVLILDGDQREREPGQFSFLPGDGSPEAALRKAAESDVVGLSGMFGRRNPQSVMDELEGLDDHDWWIAFSDLAGGQRPTLRRLLPGLLEDPSYREQAEAFLQQVKLAHG